MLTFWRGFQLFKGCAQLRTTNTRQSANNFGQVACSLVPPPSLNDGLVDPAARKAQNFLPCGPVATEKVLVTHGPSGSWSTIEHQIAQASTKTYHNPQPKASCLAKGEGNQRQWILLWSGGQRCHGCPSLSGLAVKVRKWFWPKKVDTFGLVLSDKDENIVSNFAHDYTVLTDTYGLLASGSVHSCEMLRLPARMHWDAQLIKKTMRQRKASKEQHCLALICSDAATTSFASLNVPS